MADRIPEWATDAVCRALQATPGLTRQQVVKACPNLSSEQVGAALSQMHRGGAVVYAATTWRLVEAGDVPPVVQESVVDVPVEEPANQTPEAPAQEASVTKTEQVKQWVAEHGPCTAREVSTGVGFAADSFLSMAVKAGEMIAERSLVGTGGSARQFKMRPEPVEELVTSVGAGFVPQAEEATTHDPAGDADSREAPVVEPDGARDDEPSCSPADDGSEDVEEPDSDIREKQLRRLRLASALLRSGESVAEEIWETCIESGEDKLDEMERRLERQSTNARKLADELSCIIYGIRLAREARNAHP